jgi:polar amino acid transport system substrate-binding protein
MHKFAPIAGALSVVLAGAGWGAAAAATPVRSPGAPVVVVSSTQPTCTKAGVARLLHQAPTLTVATESPAYAPWFVGDDPANGKGFESAMTYALAQQLHIAGNQVTWIVEPFPSSYAPGPKAFDFDVDEISTTPARAQAVSFSRGYFDADQALVALPGSWIGSRHSPAQLRTYTYGAQTGTTGLGYISQKIKPTHPPVAFATLDEAVAALQAHRIDAVVADEATAQALTPSANPRTVIVGRLPTGEQYALAFQKHNPLVACVNRALNRLQANGTLRKLQRQYLGPAASAPTIKP